ncbi:fibronectin type III domain-containing protein [Actinokineospora enzanensis]|uniref:fibronectin type III domain-containing protein n=1 Tax=Actinokineospora enzanensis TaxID=155975 RepID=UPI0003740095|nr:fibronectin type III domain-containing protein [Actinokineospora enzanensis]
MRVRTVVAAVLVTVGSVVVIGEPASATGQTVTVARACDSPSVGRADLTLAGDIENPVFDYLGPEPRAVTGMLTIPTAGLSGAVGVEGTVTVRLVAQTALGTSYPTRTLDLRPTQITPGQDAVIPVFGYATAAVPGRVWGSTTVDVDSVQFTLTGKRADWSDITPVSTTCVRGDQPTARWYSVTTMDMRPDYVPAPNPFSADATADSVTAHWGLTTATGYQVLLDDRVVATTGSNDTTATITGLTPETDYYVRVRPIDQLGRLVRSTAPIKVRTLPRTTTFPYTLTGTARVKGATVPLTGSLRTVLEAFSGKHTSDLTLDPTDVSARGTSAHLEFVPESPTTGTLSATVFTANARVAVVVKSVTVRGHRVLMPEGCRTAPVDLPLRSAAGFDPRLGGEVTAAFTVPPLTGCGPLTTTANALLTGGGNTVTLRLVG